MSARTLPMQGRLPDFLRMQASRDSKPVRENLMSQAADALEAQEKRIAELEGALASLVLQVDAAKWPSPYNAALVDSLGHARRVLGGAK